MNNNYIPFKFTIEGKEFEAFVTENTYEQVYGLLNKQTGYERAEGNQTYFYIGDYNNIYGEYENCSPKDDIRYAIANYYSDESVARNNSCADMLIRKLRRFAVEHMKDKLDWSNEMQEKWSICYDLCGNQMLEAWDSYTGREVGVVYFDSKATCELAIKKFHDELMWYFTEYKDSL